jgi:N-acyl-D-aspartate/D-glutamate deacylase
MDSMNDLLIQSVTVVDGTGAEPFVADVAVKDGLIVEVKRGGAIDTPASLTINAKGAHLLPGFIDIHTHYDGQVSWDETFTPSIYHGVTTLVMGNCGVGFAPVRRGQESALVDLMEGVEEIPGSVLSDGMRWGWESMSEYARMMDAMPHSIDFLTLVPHDALRLYVMGERASNGEQATADDIAQMKALLREALQDGAVGLSIGSTETHRTSKGKMTPSFEVSSTELNELATAFHGLPYRVLQAVDDFAATRGAPTEEKSRFDREYSKIEAMAQAAGRPVTISWMDRVFAPLQRKWLGDAALASEAKGVDVWLSCAPRGVGVLAGLDTTMNLFVAWAGYRAIMPMPTKERAAKMREPAVRAAILAQKPDVLSGPGSTVPPVVDFVVAHIDKLAWTMFPLKQSTDGVDYEPDPMSQSIGAMAAKQGVSVIEAMYDFMCEGDGENILYYPIYNYANGNLDIAREMLTHPKALYSLGDGGAHVGTICDASSTTTLLAHWTQQRTRGDKISLPLAVEMLSSRNAKFLGLNDRGTITVGKRADLNLVDLAKLSLPKPEIVRDLPAGGRRIVQKANGYIATFVHGKAITRDGEITNERPGRWVSAKCQTN